MRILLMGIILLPIACAYGLGQESHCPKEQAALLSATEPVYPDAIELKRTLERYGFVVHCMFPTIVWSVFEVGGDDGVMHNTVEGEVITTPTMAT